MFSKENINIFRVYLKWLLQKLSNTHTTNIHEELSKCGIYLHVHGHHMLVILNHNLSHL